MPYKNIGEQIGRSELACRLHFHQLHGRRGSRLLQPLRSRASTQPARRERNEVPARTSALAFRSTYGPLQFRPILPQQTFLYSAQAHHIRYGLPLFVRPDEVSIRAVVRASTQIQPPLPDMCSRCRTCHLAANTDNITGLSTSTTGLGIIGVECDRQESQSRGCPLEDILNE